LASFLLAYLALTKVIFGYVILCGIICFGILSVLIKDKKIRATAAVFSLAMVFCLPYLFYTYSLTKRIFYWSDYGGDNLYWMSTPYQDEFGDSRVLKRIEPEKMREERREFFEKIIQLDRLKQDDALKKEAIKNIKSHPGKYFRNWLANIGRILFSYPYSHETQTLNTFFTFVPNMFIVVFMILSGFVTFINRKVIPKEILTLLIFIAVYLFGSSLLSAERRMFFLALPVIGLWLAYVFDRFIQVKQVR
jgi:hypothetical protein